MKLSFLLAASVLVAKSAVVVADPGNSAPPGPVSHGALAFFFDEISHVLVGALAAVAGVIAHRAWERRRWRRPPEGVVVESILAVDMVDSTLIATKHGGSLAMRARNVLQRRAREAADKASFIESTGDGCLMTFASVGEAARAAATLLEGLQKRPPDMAPGPPLAIRAAITYGEILLDAQATRHGAAINKAFRLMAVAPDAFVTVEREPRVNPIPDRNRILVDEDAANELIGMGVSLRQIGVCRLRGFSGFHRAFEMKELLI